MSWLLNLQQQLSSPSTWSAESIAITLSGTSVLGLYILFQKHLLPESIARIVGRVAFWPTAPFIFLTTRMRGNYWDKIGDQVILGAAPFSFTGHVQKLHDLGVRGVVNLCDEYSGPKDQYKKLGIEQLHLSVVDHFEPSYKQLREAVDFIQEYKSRGESIYIHCRAGHGRSAAVVFCWLLEDKKMTLEEAQSFMLSIRAVRKRLASQPNINRFHDSISRN